MLPGSDRLQKDTLTPHMYSVILLCITHRREHAGWQVGSVARYAGSHGLEDSGVHGTAARVWHRATHRAVKRRRSAAQSGHDLCLAGPSAAKEMDLGRLGNLGEQSQGEVLC